MENPTDPNAGTNRTNAVSRDNLMNEAELNYNGIYNKTSLDDVGALGRWHASTINRTSASYFLYVDDLNDNISPQRDGNKYFGRAVRCVFITQRRARP